MRCMEVVISTSIYYLRVGIFNVEAQLMGQLCNLCVCSSVELLIAIRFIPFHAHAEHNCLQVAL